MVDKYYRVRKTEHIKQNGIVIRLSEGKLETFAGGCDPKEYRCKIKSRQLSVGEGYHFEEISARKAKKLRGDYISWVGMQQLTASADSIHLKNTLVGRNRPTGF